jgi:hypothetical protein
MARYRRYAGVVLLALCLLISLSGTQVKAAKALDSFGTSTCSGAVATAQFQSATAAALVCPSTVESGQSLHVVVRGRPGSRVRVDLLYPDTSAASAQGTINAKSGLAVLTLAVHYNPISRYATAQITITVTLRNGHTEVMSGQITIAQTTPVGTTVLRARAGYQRAWCPTDQAACSIRDGSTLIIMVTTDAHVQVNVSLSYPDTTSVACVANELTGDTFSDASGVYRCRLPVVFSSTITAGASIQVQATVSVDGFTRPVSPLVLSLLPR